MGNSVALDAAVLDAEGFSAIRTLTSTGVIANTPKRTVSFALLETVYQLASRGRRAPISVDGDKDVPLAQI